MQSDVEAHLISFALFHRETLQMVNFEKDFGRKEVGAAVAKCLIDIKAINFRPQNPYELTSGWASPVYIDCRKVIAHLPQRRTIIKMAVELITRKISNPIDMVAGALMVASLVMHPPRVLSRPR